MPWSDVSARRSFTVLVISSTVECGNSETISLKNALLPVFVSLKRETSGKVEYSCEVEAEGGRTSREMFEINYITTGIVAEQSYAKRVNDTTVELRCVVQTLSYPGDLAVNFVYNLGEGDREAYSDNLEALESDGWVFSSTVYVKAEVDTFSIIPATKTATCELRSAYGDTHVYAKSSNLFQQH